MYGAGSAAGTVAGAGALAYTGTPFLGTLVGIAALSILGGILAFRLARRKYREAS